MARWLELFGRLHPLVLHLPIGFLVALALLELLGRLRKEPLAGSAAATLAWLAAGSAVLAAASGYTLGQEEGYGGATLENHERLGIAVAVLSVLLAIARTRSRGGERPLALRAYRLLLALAVLLLLVAGHLGSTIAHGEDWLTAPLRTESGEPDAPELSTYQELVAPIFAANCTACHGELKAKGGLRLHEPALVLKGGEDGPVIVPGHPEASEMIRRLKLPLGDEDHMPPEGKPQPSALQVATIEAWIAAGAPVEGRVEIRVAASPPGAGSTRAALAREPAAAPGADPAALAALQEALVHVERVGGDSDLLWIDFAAVAPAIDDAAATSLLAPLLAEIAELSLARSGITDATLALLARCPHLRKLDLRSTAVTSAGLAALAGHPALEDLVLARAKLDDAAVEELLGLPALRSVSLWEAGLSPGALARLRSERPALRATAGDEHGATPLEAEGELVFTSDRPVPGAPPASSSLEPVNTTCPVSGNPVKREYAIVFRGRVIGFCCPNCPKEFWSDPAKYEGKLP